MDEKIVWPLVGVVLGWVLSLVATGLKDRADNRRKIGLLVAKLVVVHDQVLTLVSVAERAKAQADGWEEYERLRKSMTERHFLEPASHVESLRSAIDGVAGLYPLDALSLHSLIDLLLKNKKASLGSMAKHHELYVRAISAYEVGLEAGCSQLEKYIRRLALRHGWLTYAGVLRLFWSRERSRKNTDAFSAKFSGEMWEQFRRLSEQGASSAGSSPGDSSGNAVDVKP